jgi:hypothetical protein
MSENYIGMTEEELIGQLGSFRPDTPISEQLKQIIQIKLARRQAESSTVLSRATDALVAATSGLRWGTWVLAAVTTVMMVTQVLMLIRGWGKV